MRFFTFLFNFCIAIVVLSFAGGYWALNHFASPKNIGSETYFIVKKGQGLNTVAQRLEDDNIIDYPMMFKTFAYYYDMHSKIKAGEYLFPQFISPQQILNQIVSGDTVTHKLTVVEGHTVHQFLEKIAQDELLTGEITLIPQEGTLMPETYVFERNMSRDALIEQMISAQEEFLKEEWQRRARNLPIKTPQEALILASIVEKETGIASERDIVASVFINRLNIGMRLQSDPTIIYGITKGKEILKRPIYRSDIKNSQDGYNTYVINHLPPTPICNPSKEAIKAVLNPAKTDYLYFVADGTGGHVFGKTLEEHKANVKNWRKIEKKMKQKKAI